MITAGNFPIADPEEWKSVLRTTFTAETSPGEKTFRVLNYLILATGTYSALFATPGIVEYASMLLSARKVVSVIIGYQVYPAASFTKDTQDRKFFEMNQLKKDSFFVKNISIYKSGTLYDAVIAGHTETIDNGKWTINAFGNGMRMEEYIQSTAWKNHKYQSNTLLINGPSVGQSTGWPTRYQMGAGFEGGLQFLEKEVHAKHIVMHGLSLGGGMMSEAILNHDFSPGMNKGVKYLSVSDRTFDCLSNVASKIMKLPLQPIFYLSGEELDCVSAAITLSELNIRHVIIQHSSPNNDKSDRVIPDNASLSSAIRNIPNIRNKVHLTSPKLGHNDLLPQDIQDSLDKELNTFFG